MPVRSGRLAHVRRVAWRVARTWTIPLAVAIYASTYTVPLVRGWGLPGVVGTSMGVLICAALLTPFMVFAPSGRSGDFERVRTAVPWFVAATCTGSVLLAGGLLALTDVRPPFIGLLPWTVAIAVVTAIASYRYASESWATALGRALTVNDPKDAAELVGICRQVLAEQDLDADDVTIIELTLAEALIATREPDALHEGLAMLDRATASSDPVVAYIAAMRLADGMLAKAMRTGDDLGWDHALEVLQDRAAQAVDRRPEALGVAAAGWADRGEFLAERADDPQEARRLRDAAQVMLQEAVDATPEHLDDHALHQLLLASRVDGEDAHPLHGDLDGAIRRCRAVAWETHFTFSDVSTPARLVLADLFELRARLTLRPAPVARGPRGALQRLGARTRAARDLVRAIWCCLNLRHEGSVDTAARARLPVLRAELLRAIGVQLRPVVRTAEREFADVVREQMAWSHSTAAAVAATWADWAIERGDRAQAAEAAWCWVTATAADLRRRVLHDKEDVLWGVQGTFVHAAALLVQGGRPADAALALEQGRAVVLTERMHRSRDGLEQRLRAAGHAELAERWQAAERLIEDADRAAAIGVSGVAPSGVVSTEYAALADHEALLGEIGRLDGFEDVDASPDFDDLRAAAAEGPIVYLAAAETGGFALIVTEADVPTVVELPALVPAFVSGLADTVPPTNTPQRTAAAMPDVLPTLWSLVLAPVAERLQPNALVTLVALGRLTELPLHMAGAALGEDGVWRDRTDGLVFRFAPNVRVLRRAQHIAAGVGPAQLRLVTAGVASSPAGALPNAGREARAAAALFGPDAERPEPAGRAAVLDALDRCTVWHFACHGRYDAFSPLDSTLALADDALSARDLMLRKHGRRRLAILSACQTTAAAGPVPDEVVGFPSALLQAGVAGVVSCQAEVDDEAAMFVVLAFLRRLRDGEHPARALAGAQAWLRAATNAELHAAFPDVRPLPRGDWVAPGDWLAQRPFAAPATWVLFTYTGA